MAKGTVQGVGFRPFVYRLARELQLSGQVFNTPEGVEIEVQGPTNAIDAFLGRLKTDAPPLARVQDVRSEEIAALPDNDEGAFRILFSSADRAADTQISPDVAPCPDCLAELTNPGDRRHLYPFINCTNCGPRYTIVEALPYDRPKTTMKGFSMCDACGAEYADPADRRFHAQPNACAACGPQVEFRRQGAQALSSNEALTAAIKSLASGEIVAIKGAGGFHLACNAANSAAVLELRRRKGRDEKPFAVMVADVDAARLLCRVSEPEAKLLLSPQRPIVLLQAKDGAAISPHVAPGNRNLGVMLPSTPLHHLLFCRSESRVPSPESRVFVMTSGNVTDEPIAFENDDALERLSETADAFLLHDRPIRTRVDDSIAREVDGRPVLLRRARGFVPESIRMAFEMPRIFAAGADMKGAICFTRGNDAFLSQHLGDLGNALAYRAFEDAVDHLGGLLEIKPEVIACDLHPDYFSSRFARSLVAKGVSRITEVQHHHAHIAACMAENDLQNETVIGVALDGTGYGPDGTIWGGEVLLADYRDFTRVARFLPVPMPGGDAAAREPWRMAISWLEAAGAMEMTAKLPFSETITRERIEAVASMLKKRIHCPHTSSCGRLFDAVAAIAGICSVNSFEGQAAMALEQVADEAENETYSFEITDTPSDGSKCAAQSEDKLYEIDFSSTIASIASDAASGVPSPTISAKFHNTVVEALVGCLALVNRRTQGRQPRVCLSGGCFQNALLLTNLKKRLEAEGFAVYTHSLVPANDGGVALGQAVIAAHRFRKA